jgi:TRAP-type mannitol/chloroaromatic compound transport system permease small subunit
VIEAPPGYTRVIGTIDRLTERIGKLVSLSMLFLVASITYECFSRYVFDSPTIWVFETSYLTNGSAFMLGCAYALLKGAHVRTDMLWAKYSERKKGLIDLVAYLLFFYPALITLFVISFDDAWYAYQIGETSEQTPWRPILWPFRAVIPLTALLLMIQGASESLKSWHQVRTGREFEHHEKFEV